jgi:hypothetical protein
MITGLIKLIFKLVFLPFRVALGLLGITFKAGAGTAKLSGRTVKGVGISRIFCFFLGAAIGYLAGSPAARDRVLELVQGFTEGVPASPTQEHASIEPVAAR